MRRTLLMTFICGVIVGVAASATVVTVRDQSPSSMTEEQRIAHDKFFGIGKALPPIPKGQEMRPRW